MTKRLVDIDDKLLEDAKRFFGTTTIRETVHAAMYEGVRIKVAFEMIDRMKDPDIWDPEGIELVERHDKPWLYGDEPAVEDDEDAVATGG